MTKVIRIIFFVQLLVICGLNSYAQTPEEMKKTADVYFEQGNYVAATPLYSRLLSNNPTDVDLNFKYGTCLLYNSRNKSEAIRHLSFACKSTAVDKRAYFYLGRAYHLNYQFNDAITWYEKFKTVGTPTQIKDFQVDVQIQACKNGKKLLSSVTDMIVIKKTEIKKEDFYEIYDLSNIGGTILVTDEFQTKLDKQRGHRAVIHFPSNSPAIYFSSYGDDGSTGLDIYVCRKLPDGKYSQPQKVKGGVNTPYDEDFAYMHPDGRYLYFCSKGHNSMGGYDVFRCAYDENTNSFGPAENMDFAISSPDDDILFVVDSLDQVAYFSSARESQDGKVFVYSVRVERIPLQISVIKGSFINSIFAANKVVSIEVQDFSSGETIGTFNSKEANGDYLITFPKPGKYIYYITVKGSDVTHKAIVEIPYTPEFRPLKQRITVARNDMGEEYVKVENLFNEGFDDPVAVMAEIYRELSALVPNSTKYNIDSLNELNKKNDVFTESGLDPYLSKSEVETVVDVEITELKNAIAQDEKNAAIAYHMAEQKSDSANALMVEVNSLIDQAEKTTDPIEKQRLLNDANTKTNTIEKLNDESKSLIEMGNAIDVSIDKKENSLNQAYETKNDLKNTPDGDKVALAQTVEENKTFFAENVKDQSPAENIVTETVNSNVSQATTTQQLNSEINSLRNKQNELEKKNESLQNQANATKNKKEKETLEQQILENQNSIEELKVQIQQKEKQYDVAIQSGSNSSLGTGAEIVDNPKNATPENIKPLSESEKNSITNKVNNNNLDENISQVNQVLKENNIGGPVLNLFESNETTSKYSLQQWNQAIDSEIEKLKVDRLNASPQEREKIDQEILRYEELKDQKKREFEKVVDPTTISPTFNKDDIVSGYESKKQEINRITDENEKHQQNLALNQQLKNELVAEKNQLEKVLEENPGNKNIQERIANVDKMITETDAQIVADQNWIKQNSGTVVLNKNEVIAQVDPSYQSQVNTIYNSTNEQERKTQITQLNESFTEKSNERIQELEAIIQSNPNDLKAQAELEELKKLNQQVVTNPDQPLVSPVVIDVASVSPKVEPTQIIPNYTERKNDIAKISDPYDKRKAENELNLEMSNSIRNEIRELEKLLEQNPGNTAIQQRIDNLKKLDDQLNSTIVANDNWMKANPKQETDLVQNSDVIVVNPEYQTEVDKINKITDPNQKNQAIVDLNNQTLNNIDNRLNEVDKTLTSNPNDVIAQQEKAELTELKNQIQTNPNQTLTQPTNVSTINTKPTIGELMPDYQPKMDNINASNQTTIEKEKDKIELNENLITVIDAEINTLNNLKQSNPAAAKDIDKRIAGLNSIKTTTQNEINTSKTKIGESTTTTTNTNTNYTAESVMPGYDKEMNTIQKKSKDETNKLSAENTLNTELIGAIDNKKNQLQQEKINNPNNSQNIDQQLESLNQLRDEKQNDINRNNDRLYDLNNSSSDISISTLMPGYEPGMIKINESGDSEISKLEQKNNLNTQLIGAIDNKIASLENEKAANPDRAAAIDKDIQSLQNLKTQKQNEITQNNNRINEIKSGNSSTTSTSSDISISTLMPGYQPGMDKINASSDNEISKLEQKNSLNTQLIGAIDNKIASLENELKTNPSNAAQIQQNIEKLEELKEAKQAEISKNNELIRSMSSSDMTTKSVTQTNSDDFSSQHGKDVINGHQETIDEINNLNQDIEDLNNQLANTTDSKEQAKLEKQIDKKEATQAKLENEILEDLGSVNEQEINNQKSNTQVTGDIANAHNPNDASLQQADMNMKQADILMNEAQSLRNEAANEKDPIIANQKLELAFEKEQEAKNLIEEANRIYKTAEVIDNMDGNKAPVITSVPENSNDRESTQLLNEATALDLKANALNDEANHLRDSSLTVKKKYRDALVVEADRLDSLANIYRSEANQIRTEANQIKSQEEELLSALPEHSNMSVDNATVKDVTATEEYKNYYEAKTNGDSYLFKADELGNEIADLEAKKQRIIKDAIVEYGTGPELDKALANNAEYQETQSEIDRLTNLQNQYKDKALDNYSEAQDVLDKTDSQTRDYIVAISDKDLLPVEEVAVNPIEADFNAPDQLNSSIFRTTNGNPVYNNTKPIPVDQQQPSGLVYKVQVGAFRKPLPPEYFNQFAPISGQNIGDGITRYMVGYFTNFTIADSSKELVHDLGYNDAFVVAYCNGQRISLAEAKEIEAGRKVCAGTDMVAVNNMSINQTTTTTTSTNNTGNTNGNAGTNTGNQTIKPNTENEKQLTSYYTSVPDAAPANQVEIIKGLFFTVQIGVYSKPVKASLLFNITPLNSQLTENGKIRYTTGIYCNQADATKRKDEIVQIGITDAFVTAYYNGKRITLAEADQLIAQNGPSILFDCAGTNNNQIANTNNQNTNNQNSNNNNQNTNNQNTNNQNTNNQNSNNQNANNQNTNNQNTNNQNTNNQNTNNQNTNTNNQNTNTNNQNTNTSNQVNNNQFGAPLIYDANDTTGLWRVRVGYFVGDIPDYFIELLLEHQDEGIVSESYLDSNVTFYTIPYTSRPVAEDRKEDLIDKGFKDAQIQKMPENVDELGNVVIKPAVPKEVYYKDGVYYRIVIGKFANEIPGEFATILLQTEGILETEVDADGNTYIISRKILTFEDVKTILYELNDLGIETMEIVTYYKYDPIPFDQGQKILNDQPIDELEYLDAPEGISADPYLYDKNKVYFRVNLGAFNDQVPQEFANILFENGDEKILKEETFDGKTYYYTENIKSYEEAVQTLERLKAKGFTGATLVAFHKFDEISVAKAKQLLED